VKKRKLLRIGLAGLHFPVMAAEEHKVFESGKTLLGSAASADNFELLAWPRMISEASEATKAAQFFEEEGIDFLLVQMSSLIMGDVVLPLAEKFDRIGAWVLDEPRYTGELPLNSLTGYNLFVSLIRGAWGERKKIAWFWGTGSDFSIRLQRTVQALTALKEVADRKIVSIGGTVPSFSNLEGGTEAFRESMGIGFEHLEIEKFFGMAESAPDSAIDGIVASLAGQAAHVRVGSDLIKATAGICYALQMAKDEYGADAAALRCWPEFQSWKSIAPCAAVAWANDHCMPVSCEGDWPGAAAMLLGSILSGSAATMNDPVALDRETGTIQMWHCGPGPASWADCDGQCLDYHHTLNRRPSGGASPMGVSSDIRFAKGPVTILRIRTDGKSLFAMDGDIVDGPAPSYPGSGGWVGNLRMGVEQVSLEDLLQMMAAYGLEHHYPVMHGHHYDTLNEMAGWADWTMLPRIGAGRRIVV